MRRRTVAVMLTMAVVSLMLSGRLFSLTQSELQTASQMQSTRREVFAVSRGTIYDRYRQPLVNRSTVITASVSPFSACIDVVDDAVGSARMQTVLPKLKEGKRATVSLKGWLPPTLGIVQVSAPVRYDESSLACHVVGYVNGENHGVSGIEKSFDDVLSSFEGEASVSYQIDALGCVSGEGHDRLENTLDNAKGGVVLTIDAQIQSVVQELASAYMERGAVLVCDVQSNEVLASVSLPLFDPDAVEQVLQDEASPLLDRTRLNYNCGSVFKVLTAAAALENGFSPYTTFVCNGSTTVDGVTFHCHNVLGDGRLTMKQAMACSCNCYFIQLACKLGASALYDMARVAELDTAWTIADGMQTACGVLPAKRDLSADAALANLSIGQGDLLLTPYHVASLLQAVANDGIMTIPSLYYGAVNETGAWIADPSAASSVRLFSSETAQELMTMLQAVTEQGTGQAAQPMFGRSAGKTGTAETGWQIDGEEVVQSWFAGVYPAEHPQYTVTIISENGGANGKSAAPLFAQIVNALFREGLVENPQDLY